ncbi:MAG: toxin-activating lysine-acyltransferase [Haliea sp.]|nr:MAG: toxin-activating lysine-acyltransferase [Haliea sp.]
MDAPARQEIEKIARLSREQANNVLKKIPALGPVAWLMMANAGMRHTLLSELEWRVMPALVLDQAKLYLRDEPPVGFVS